jgi:phosphopantothenoylcysteine decarboxylase/phosphopantothenate--cysteine ligase
VRFITNASSGRMGVAVALDAAAAGHQVTLLLGPVCDDVVARAAAAGCIVKRFVTFDDLRVLLAGEFASTDALIMSAAVGDFRVQARAGKIPRGGGPITLNLTPTEDLLGGLCAGGHAGKIVIGFAVEALPQQEAADKARAEMAAKGVDYTVVNSPAAMGSEESLACIISRGGVALPWATRPKAQLAGEIVKLLALEKI